jgi:glycosyltransferase involved in cell wall biosynthesis
MAKDYLEQTKVTPKKYSVIYNPVQIDHVKKLAQNSISENYTFVAVGRLNAQKDYENLISACAILKNKTSDFSLVILGQGDLQEKLADLIQTLELGKNVFLLGHKSKTMNETTLTVCAQCSSLPPPQEQDSSEPI